jgi:hypothetical protein
MPLGAQMSSSGCDAIHGGHKYCHNGGMGFAPTS